MSKLLRALFFSAVSIGVAALAARVVSGRRWPPAGRSTASGDMDRDADALTPEQRDLLLAELDAQV
ncbi:MAG TPA: hypothetical protein VFG50_04085 [Rhodothermales bacterium]|nr:hypothetical protein [Rhodothermales bacterium]